jgi:hypothetical protein
MPDSSDLEEGELPEEGEVPAPAGGASAPELAGRSAPQQQQLHRGSAPHHAHGAPEPKPSLLRRRSRSPSPIRRRRCSSSRSSSRERDGATAAELAAVRAAAAHARRERERAWARVDREKAEIREELARLTAHLSFIELRAGFDAGCAGVKAAVKALDRLLRRVKVCVCGGGRWFGASVTRTHMTHAMHTHTQHTRARSATSTMR